MLHGGVAFSSAKAINNYFPCEISTIELNPRSSDSTFKCTTHLTGKKFKNGINKNNHTILFSLSLKY